jgi:integrase
MVASACLLSVGSLTAGTCGSPLDWRITAKRHFAPVLKAAGLSRIRPYDLRHTCATHLLALEVNPKIVSERHGHASIAQTLDTYTHVLPPMQREAVSRLEDLYAGVSGTARAGS